MKILNLTQHAPSNDQLTAGVVNLTDSKWSEVKKLMTFDTLPSTQQLQDSAFKIAQIASETDCKKAMIGGAPFFMSALQNNLIAVGIKPVFAFSMRESVDVPQDDGSVRKMAVFKHLGFVEV